MIRSSSPAGAPTRRKFVPAAMASAAACPVLLIALAGGVSDAMAQATPAPAAPGAPAAPAAPAGVTSFKPIEDRLKQVNGPLPAADIAALDASIKDKIALLSSETAGDPARARTWLVNETAMPGGQPAKASYLAAYANAVNINVAPLIAAPSPRVRLNAAIIVAETARTTGGVQLAPTALTLLNDKSDAVVLWGMKAARWIIPAQLRQAVGVFNKQLADAVVPTVTRHSEGQVAGAIADEAYNALTLDVLNPAAFTKYTDDQVKTIAPYVIALEQARVPLYQKGVPPNPRAETTGTRFLTDPKVWRNLTPPQQAAAMQSMSDIIALATEQAKAANPGDRAELAATVRGASLAVALQVPAANATQIQAAAAYRDNQATPSQIAGVAAAVAQGLKATPQFAALKPPPPIKGNEAAPPPASAPTTGQVLIPGEGAAPAAPTTPPATAVPPGTSPATGPAGTAPKAPPAGGTAAPKTPPAAGGAPPHPPANAPKTGAGAAGAGATPTPRTPAR